MTVVPTGWIWAWVGLVHPANSAQNKSALQAAAGIRYLMDNPFIREYFWFVFMPFCRQDTKRRASNVQNEKDLPFSCRDLEKILRKSK